MNAERWQIQNFAAGAIGIVAADDALCRICFRPDEQQVLEVISRDYPGAAAASAKLLSEAFAQLDAYFNARLRVFDLPLNRSRLSPFSCRVHDALCNVNYGSLISYAALARLAGSPGAARAVGRVMALNPLPLVVPCHRVVNADGRIGHYSGGHGSATKAWLIRLEQGHCAA